MIESMVEVTQDTAEGGCATQSSFETVRCYYCNSGIAATHFITAEDDLTGRPGRFTFVRCLNCGLVYQSPRLTIEHIKSYYDGEYLAHRRRTDWGVFSPLLNAAMDSLDRQKLRIIRRYINLAPSSAVLDVGCGAGTFLQRIHAQHGSTVTGVDFMDLAELPAFREDTAEGGCATRHVQFRRGLFYEQEFGRERFDLITMWHYLEHDYDPVRSLVHARDILKTDGRLIIEVPRLDSATFRLFRDRWPGLQAPPHTALYDRAMLTKMVEHAGYEVLDYLPYGAFPPYFYLFCGAAFKLLKGRGLNMRKAIFPYFAGQLLLLPVMPFIKRRNLAMQTIVCRKAS